MKNGVSEKFSYYHNLQLLMISLKTIHSLFETNNFQHSVSQYLALICLPAGRLKFRSKNMFQGLKRLERH